jgi:RsiW-degrading membrane proteinase PrsW (M82 family)
LAFVIFGVLSAALLHAVWNTIVKGHSDKLTMMLAIAIVQFSIAVMMVPFLGYPVPEAWIWLGLAGPRL